MGERSEMGPCVMGDCEEHSIRYRARYCTGLAHNGKAMTKLKPCPFCGAPAALDDALWTNRQAQTKFVVAMVERLGLRAAHHRRLNRATSSRASLELRMAWPYSRRREK